MPMLTLLKQARAYGLGCVLATQNPVDLDYKGLSNTGTWLLGRLQTERDKMRVIEGLEGASATTGAAFDRGEMERLLAGLGRRNFLINNVHEDGPVLFQTRWAMSYLRGPLTRKQIARLTEKQGVAAPEVPEIGRARAAGGSPRCSGGCGPAGGSAGGRPGLSPGGGSDRRGCPNRLSPLFVRRGGSSLRQCRGRRGSLGERGRARAVGRRASRLALG